MPQMHPSDMFAHDMLYFVIHEGMDLEEAIRRVDNHSIGARCRFYHLVDEYTTP
jgi:hypothetical protein